MRDTLREPLLPAELPGALGEAADPTGEARAVTGVRIMAYEGLVLRIGSNLRGNTLRYVATEAWLGRPLEEHNPAEALGWLAGEYLRGYGPARVADLAWWPGRRAHGPRRRWRRSTPSESGGGLLLPPSRRRRSRGSRRSTPRRWTCCRSGTPTRWASLRTAASGSSPTSAFGAGLQPGRRRHAARRRFPAAPARRSARSPPGVTASRATGCR